jgi:hypothetical protein
LPDLGLETGKKKLVEVKYKHDFRDGVVYN